MRQMETEETSPGECGHWALWTGAQEARGTQEGPGALLLPSSSRRSKTLLPRPEKTGRERCCHIHTPHPEPGRAFSCPSPGNSSQPAAQPL